MNDVIIKIDTSTAKTYCENNKIGVKHANLQNKLIFKMTEKIIGNAWLEYEIDGEKNYAEMEEIEDGYQIIIKSCLLISDCINVDLKITETENADGIPVFVSTKEKLEVYDSINASKEEPEYYPDWKTTADSKIAEINQLKRDLNIAESTRIENENTRQSSETTRIENEVIRQTNEATRINNESTRVTAENERISAESGRVSSEAARSAAELVRVSNENTRISNEETRASNESTRTLNEQTRTANETVREEYINNLKKDVEDGKFDGNGIVSFSKTSTTGLVDTYTIVFTDGATTTLTVTNGKGISSIIKTSTIGLTDTYTITYNDNTTSTFQIINGRGIDSINLTSTQDNIDTYTISYNDGTTSTFTVTNSTVTDQEFDKLTNEVDKYKTIYNVLPKASGEGTDIELKDTGNAMLVFDSLKGDTSQKTTTGKNLFDKDNQVKVQVNSGGTLRYGIIVDAPNKKVSISAKSWNNSIALKPLINGTYGDFLNINSNTTLDVVDKLIIYATSDTDKLDLNIEELQVEINDVPTDYEPYTGSIASPNPNYPQPIRVVTGEQNITIQSKNLFDKSNYSNNRIVSRATGELAQNNSYGTTDYIKVKANQTYYQSNVNAYYSVLYDENKEYYGIIGTAKFTPAIDGYIRTSFSKVDLYLVQIEIGEVATTYAPCQSQNYPLSLGNIELARTNNHKDYIFKNEVGSPYYNADLDLNEWYLHKVIGKATLTENSWGGVRNVTIGGTSRPIFYSRNDIFKSYDSMASMMCNYFQVKKTYGTSPTANNQFYCNYERTNNLEFAKFDLTTAAEWKEWLSTHNIVLIGKMVNPTNTKITDTTLIQQLENINNNARSYSDTTIIICSSESEDNETIQASVTALKDISTLFEQVNDAIIEIGGGE